MTDIHLSEDNPIINKSIIDVVKKYNSKVIMASVKRGDNVFIPGGDFTFNVDDILSIIGKDTDIADFCKKIKIFKAPAKSVSIIGGGKIGFYLAEELVSAGLDVKIIEKDDKRCEVLSNEREGVTVLHGDGGDKSLLIEENLSKTDALVSLTGADEENAIVSLYAKTREVPKIVTLIGTISYIDFFKSAGLLGVVSPKLSTAAGLVRYVRSINGEKDSETESLYKLFDGSVEVLEFLVKEEIEGLTDVPLKDLDSKEGILIACIMHENEIVIPKGDDVIRNGDTVLVVSLGGQLKNIGDIVK
jgi:trk system potassium uptake protein TrkA